MASCQRLLRGRATKCKSSVGGVKNLYLVPYDTMGDVVLDEYRRIVSVSNNPNAFQFEAYKDSTLTQNVMSSFENGTTFVDQIVDITLKQLDYITDDMVMDFAWSRYHIIVEDNNGNLLFCGYEFGYNSAGAAVVTGKTLVDFTGYNVTFTFKEKRLANYLDGSLAEVGFNVVEPQDVAFIWDNIDENWELVDKNWESNFLIDL
jgi:hypothetical protein